MEHKSEDRLELISLKTYTKVSLLLKISRFTSLFIYLFKWETKFNVSIRLKYKIQLSIYVCLVFIEYLSLPQLKLLLESIIFQRLWDDIYDDKHYTLEELITIKNAIFDGKLCKIEVASKLRNIFLDLQKKLTAVNPLAVTSFINETKNIIEGYEYEFCLSKSNLNQASFNNYLRYASTTIGLKYIMSVINIVLVKSVSDKNMFDKAYENIEIASESIRLANDISGHNKEKMQNKVDALTIYESVQKCEEQEAKKYIFDRIYSNLFKFYKEDLSNNKFNNILCKISSIAIKRYLEKKL